jgi:hypothetical protein
MLVDGSGRAGEITDIRGDARDAVNAMGLIVRTWDH